MKLFTIMMIAAALWSTQCSAQQDSVTVASAADSVKAKSTLTLGTSYSNNADYYGQRALQNIPYAAVAANYRLKCGLYFSGLAYKLLNDSDAFVSAANMGVGMAFKLSRRWSADMSYSHTFYPAYSPFLQASNPDNASVSLSYENWLSSKINADYAFGKTKDVFITAGTAKQVTLGHISPKDLITLTPEINVTAGTQHFYQSYLTEQKLRDSVLGIVFAPIFGPPGSTAKTIVTTQFNIISYNFKCPLAYNRSHYMFELAYQLSVLSNKAESMPGKANSFMSASFYYQF